MSVPWRVFEIDWYKRGLLAAKAHRIVREVYGPMVPLRLYWMLKYGHYSAIIDGFTLRR